MPSRFIRLAVAVVLVLALCGCGSRTGTPIEPLTSGSGGTEFRLGEGVTPMSRGPGYKSSPVWSPNGDRLAFIVDGYVVDESTEGRDERVWTTRDFDAQKIMWSGNSSILATSVSPDEDSNFRTGTVYRSLVPENSVEVSEVISGVSASARIGNGSYLVSLRRDAEEVSSGLAVIRGGRIVRNYPDTIPGEVTGISVSPDGDGRTVLAVRNSGDASTYELRIFDLSDGDSETVLSLDRSSELFGAPQWSSDGIYYVARDPSDETLSTSGRLYRLSSDDESAIAPEVGRAFTASSISLSPDGQRLAIVGRLRPNSQTNLHVLDLGTDELRSLTSSNDMEIKNGSDDLAWSPSGAEIAFVARGDTSGTRIHSGTASSLLEEFYNVYRVPTS